jgi:nicotinamide riboside transporter PnuC
MSIIDSFASIIFIAAMGMAVLRYKEWYYVLLLSNITGFIFMILQIALLDSYNLIPTLIMIFGYVLTASWGVFYKWNPKRQEAARALEKAEVI